MRWYDLTLWTLKCVAELWLMGVCLNRRVRTVWLLGAYSFFTTLGLMLVAQNAPMSYNQVVAANSTVENFIMAFIFVGLLHQMIRKRWSYVPIMIAYIGMILSQIICTVYRWHSPTAMAARLDMAAWLLAVIAMTIAAAGVPREYTPISRHLWRDLILSD